MDIVRDTPVECQVWWSTPLPVANDHLALLDAPERERYETFRREVDRRRFLTGRVLAKRVVAQHLGTDPARVSFDATCPDCGKPHGRPQLPGSAIELSISHSGERIGLALVHGAPVGLDVEATDRESIDDLIRYAFTDAERASVDRLSAQERLAAFFGYWSRKEALMKASGLGLKLPLRALTVSAPGEPARLVASEHPALNPASTRLVDLDPGTGYRAALAVLTAAPITVTERWWTA